MSDGTVTTERKFSEPLLPKHAFYHVDVVMEPLRNFTEPIVPRRTFANKAGSQEGSPSQHVFAKKNKDKRHTADDEDSDKHRSVSPPRSDETKKTASKKTDKALERAKSPTRRKQKSTSKPRTTSTVPTQPDAGKSVTKKPVTVLPAEKPTAQHEFLRKEKEGISGRSDSTSRVPKKTVTDAASPRSHKGHKRDLSDDIEQELGGPRDTIEQLEALNLPVRQFKDRPSSEIARLMTAHAIRDSTMTFTPSHVRLAERSNKTEKMKLEKLKILLDTKQEVFNAERDEFDQKKKKMDKENEKLMKEIAQLRAVVAAETLADWQQFQKEKKFRGSSENAEDLVVRLRVENETLKKDLEKSKNKVKSYKEASITSRDRHLKSNQSNQYLIQDLSKKEAAWLKEKSKIENELNIARVQLKYFEEEQHKIREVNAKLDAYMNDLLSSKSVDDKQLREALSKNRADFETWKAEHHFVTVSEAKKTAMEAVKIQIKSLEEENKRLKRELKAAKTSSSSPVASKTALPEVTPPAPSKKSKTVKTSKKVAKSKRRGKEVKRREMTEEKETERTKKRQSSLLVLEKEVDRRKTLASGAAIITTPISQMGKTYVIEDNVKPLYAEIDHDVFRLAKLDVFTIPLASVQQALTQDEEKDLRTLKKERGYVTSGSLKGLLRYIGLQYDVDFNLFFLMVHTYLISPVILLKTVILFFRAPHTPIEFHIDEDGLITVKEPSADPQTSKAEYKQRLIKFLNCWIVSMYDCLNEDQSWRKLFVMFCNHLTVSPDPQDADVRGERNLTWDLERSRRLNCSKRTWDLERSRRLNCSIRTLDLERKEAERKEAFRRLN
eukprot:TRINITY_DN4770_c0_g1_i1.p1 TRINITY_DN4770_c0_g1~~TRINITY_DN4770_c0_g1_i1.p1  ORF type:complete len:836 (-),score=211.14 TRINITY_DN4770_c0_g1_i1:935-3442(-)